MRKPTLKCALVAAMVAKHRWGTPVGEERLLAISAVATHDYPDARRALSDLRDEPFVSDLGSLGIELDNGRFDDLAEFLFHECGWRPFEIQTRLKHYEGLDRHDWV